MRHSSFTLIAALLIPTLSVLADAPVRSLIQPVWQPSRSPIVSFRILFRAGAANDPQEKEGVAALTAAMLAKGGSRDRSYEQIVEAMYPMATSFDWQVDKEMTVFVGATHVDNLDKYYELIHDMLLNPGFREDDFARLKSDAINFLKVSLRDGNDEELGKEELYNQIYQGHPYGHQNLGRVSSLERLTIDDVRGFYRRHYTQACLVAGLAGGYPASFPEKMLADFSKLPRGRLSLPRLKRPDGPPGTRIELIERETGSTAFSLGFPIQVKRGDPDWAALELASSYLGQHRSSNGRLYQRLREARGLNYGDYAYIEYFPRGMFQFEPDPNLARRQQIFQIWIRPVEPKNALFALRGALFEFDKLTREGLSEEAFQATRQFLTKNVNILLQTQDARLGYALDSRCYGIGDFDAYLAGQLGSLTRESVNETIRRRLKSNSLHIVAVTKNAASLRDAILQSGPSPITYNSPKPKEITDEDKVIEVFPIRVKPDAVRVTPVDQIFQ